MTSFAKVIREAYDDVLAHEPDPAGLAAYDRSMNQGLSEADLREVLLRSREFSLRFPDAQLALRLGMNAHVPEDAILDDIRGNLGLTWIRVDFDWYRIQPEQARFDWEADRRRRGALGRAGARGAGDLVLHAALGFFTPGEPCGRRPAGGDLLLDRLRPRGDREVRRPRAPVAVLERAEHHRLLERHDAPVPDRDPRAGGGCPSLARPRAAGGRAGAREPPRLARLVPRGHEREGVHRRGGPPQLRGQRARSDPRPRARPAPAALAADADPRGRGTGRSG